jgi:hypothetical protein
LRDLPFINLFSQPAEGKHVLIERQVWQSHKFTISGTVDVPGPGTLYAVFDNRYSVFRKKIVKYRMQIREEK